MINQAELFESINKDLKFYEILPSCSVIGEEGKLIEGDEVIGYQVCNRVTGVVEHTSTILPGALFQAQHFDNTLRSLTDTPEDAGETEAGPDDDVVLN